ncbi:MAG TPA: hypothetical protein VKR58_05705 [Aquella sp.]|nr:hypothetical protein [Aquella sp.]
MNELINVPKFLLDMNLGMLASRVPAIVVSEMLLASSMLFAGQVTDSIEDARKLSHQWLTTAKDMLQ